MRELRLAMLGLAAVMLLLIAVGFIARALHPSVPAGGGAPVSASVPSTTSSRARVEAAIADAPDYARFFDRLRLAFPSDYDSIVAALAASQAQRGGQPDADVMMADAVAMLRHARGELAAKASDAALGQIFSSNLREMKALGEVNSGLCVAFLFGGSADGFAGFAADHRGLVADTAIAGLDAMSSGRAEGVSRAKPSSDDFKMLEAAMAAKGMTKDEIGKLLDDKTAAQPIPEADMCRAGQTYYETLATLPEATRDRVYALAVDLMAKT